MRYSRSQLTEIITPHVLRTVVRLHAQHGANVSDADVLATGLTDEQRQALIQTKRLLAQEDGGYKIHLYV